MSTLHVRLATIEDTPLILKFIKELADYEKLLSEVTATEAILRKTLFEDHKAEVIIGEVDGQPVAFALFFSNFSTFVGKPGLYLEDLYVKPEFRGAGFGKQLLAYLAHIAVERDYGRFEWWCLDWNTSSIEFYKRMGAKPMNGWTVYRVDGDELTNLANQNIL